MVENNRTLEELTEIWRLKEERLQPSKSWPMASFNNPNGRHGAKAREQFYRHPCTRQARLFDYEYRDYNVQPRDQEYCTRTYNLEFETSTGRTALEAFPDETGIHYINPTYPVHFLVLVSTAHELSAIPSLNQDKDDSVNMLGMPLQTTYSGTGILIIPPKEYLHRSAVHSRVKEAEERSTEFRVKHPEQNSYEVWAWQKLEGEMKNLVAFIKQL